MEEEILPAEAYGADSVQAYLTIIDREKMVSIRLSTPTESGLRFGRIVMLLDMVAAESLWKQLGEALGKNESDPGITSL